jgi:hypothetical protein
MSEDITFKELKDIASKVRTARRSTRGRGLSYEESKVYYNYKQKLDEVQVICGSPIEVSRKATELFKSGYQIEAMSEIEAHEGEICLTMSGRKKGLTEKEFIDVVENIGLEGMRKRVEEM